MISKAKGRHDTIDDFIKKMFEQWLEWKATISLMEETYPQQSKTITNHLKDIEFKEALQHYPQQQQQQVQHN